MNEEFVFSKPEEGQLGEERVETSVGEVELRVVPTMSPTLSIFLDALRLFAAIVVVAGHFTESTFSNGWPDLTRFAIAAVAIFFVLSGFVISFVARTKEDHPIDYAVARISRLYSVLLPAIVLSGLVFLIGLWLDTDYVLRNFPWTSLRFLPPVPRFFAQSLLPLTFLNSIHDHYVFPTLDSPMWSLGFEGAYYALFGIGLFMRGWRRVVVFIALCLLFGTGILRLFPVWLAGVAVDRLTIGFKLPSRHTVLLGVTCIAIWIAGVFAWPSVDAWSKQPHASALQLVMRGKYYASETCLFYYWGFLTCVLILAVIALEKPIGRLLFPLEKPIRWCAAHTFSLYLFHFPVLVLIYVVTHYDRGAVGVKALVFVADIAICVLLSTFTESKKLWWRKVVRHWFDHFRHPAKEAHLVRSVHG